MHYQYIEAILNIIIILGKFCDNILIILFLCSLWLYIAIKRLSIASKTFVLINKFDF